MRTITSEAECGHVPAGEAVICGYPTWCSACWRLGDQSRDKEGVVLAVITWRPNIGRPGFWHGWWSCPDHWARGAIRPRWEATGSVTA